MILLETIDLFRIDNELYEKKTSSSQANIYTQAWNTIRAKNTKSVCSLHPHLFSKFGFCKTRFKLYNLAHLHKPD